MPDNDDYDSKCKVLVVAIWRHLSVLNISKVITEKHNVRDGTLLEQEWQKPTDMTTETNENKGKLI